MTRVASHYKQEFHSALGRRTERKSAKSNEIIEFLRKVPLTMTRLLEAVNERKPVFFRAKYPIACCVVAFEEKSYVYADG